MSLFYLACIVDYSMSLVSEEIGVVAEAKISLMSVTTL